MQLMKCDEHCAAEIRLLAGVSQIKAIEFNCGKGMSVCVRVCDCVCV